MKKRVKRVIHVKSRSSEREVQQGRVQEGGRNADSDTLYPLGSREMRDD